jgi:tRNA-2-methylthio-N6-dimethylallyladenosine synthase
MSPHPRDFTDDVIAAMAETPNVMPHLHMPLQSGSDRILQAMRRSYRSDRYLGIIEKVRTAIPKSTITTDIIVGFPGESDEDFQATMDLASVAQFSAAYTYKYSIRPGTPAGWSVRPRPDPPLHPRHSSGSGTSDSAARSSPATRRCRSRRSRSLEVFSDLET